jgi:phospholipase C
MAAASLHLGAFGDDVARLHQALTQRGLAVSSDEVKRRFFGPSTRAALIDFQRKQRHDTTGTLDDKTAAALSGPPPPAPAALKARSVATTRLASALTARDATAGGAASTSSTSVPRAGSVLLGDRVGIDLSNIQVVQGTFEQRDPCAAPVETFATDQQVLSVTVGPNASAEVRFGPANAGPGIVVVDMYQTLAPPPTLGGVQVVSGTLQVATRRVQAAPPVHRAAGGSVGAGGLAGAGGGVVALATDTGPGSGGGTTPPPGTGPLPQGAFRIELRPNGVNAAVVATGLAPLMFTLPEPPVSRLAPSLVAGSVILNDATAPNWVVRISNTTNVYATGKVHVTFVDNRPILHKAFDLDALNHLLCRVIAGSARVSVAFENRPGGRFTGETTYLVVLPDQDMQRQFGVHEFNLGVKLLDRRYESAPMKVRLVVNDGRLALKTRIDFPYGAMLQVENLASFLIARQIGPSSGSNIVERAFSALIKGLENALADLVADSVLPEQAKIKTLSADIMFTMRDGSLNPLEGANNSADILVRPYIDLDGIPGSVTTLLSSLVEGFIGRAYDFANPAYNGLAGLRKIAGTIHDTLGHYLLGRDKFELTRQSSPDITLSFAGDAPQGPVLTQSDVGPPDAPLPDPGLLANIDHIVVLMMENRSFDHVLGHLSLPTSLGGLGRGDVIGLKGTEFNVLRDGRRVYVFPFTRAPSTLFGYDPGHGFSDQKIQRGGQILKRPVTTSPKPRDVEDDIGDDFDTSNDITVPPMGGFVLAHAQQLTRKYSAAELKDRSRNYGNVATDIMGYHLPADVSMFSFLAENYLICDHWYAAHPGNTWPNRFITLTGNLAPKPPHDPHAGSPEIGTPDPQDFTPVHVKNIFDHLDDAGVTWRYYEHDLCMLRLFADYTLGHPNIVQINDPVQGLQAAARAGTLPSVTFIDPDLTDIPAGNDDHPPTDIARGQTLVKRVYDAIANSPQWEKTLLIITYDEYGGFYDHVLPREVSDPEDPEYVSPMFNDPQFPEQAPPGQFTPKPVHYRGVRVPAFIISPWVAKRGVSHLTFDHTSILKTIVTRFLHENPPHLGERVSRANGLERVLSAPRVTVTPGSGDIIATARRVARVAAASPRLSQVPAAAPQIAPDGHAEDFRTLISSVRDRFGLKSGMVDKPK